MTPGRPETPERGGLTRRLAQGSAIRGHRRAEDGQVRRAGRRVIEWLRHGIQLLGDWALLRRLAGWLHRPRSAGQMAPEKSSIDNRHILEGHFWLPGRETNRQAGVLRVGPGLAPSVATVEPLLSPWREVSRTVQPNGRIAVTQEGAEEELTTPVTVHGLGDRGQPLTLINAITVAWGGADPAGYAHQFRGIQAVVGGHVRDRDHAFTGFRVRLHNMEAWRPRLQQARWTAEAHLARGGSLTIEDLPISGQASGSALWLTGQSLPPATLRSMGTYYVQPLISFFTLATGRPCPPLSLQVQGDSPDGPWWDVYSAALQADDEKTDLQRDLPQWLLRPEDVGLHQIGTWLDKVPLLGPLPAVVADLTKAQSISLDTQALLLATTAEGLHRRLYPGDLRFHEDAELNSDVAERVRAAAAQAVDPIHADAGKAVDGLLGHVGDVGYAKRLERLAQVAKAAAPEVTGRTSRWKNLAYEVRNEYAHRIKASFLEDTDIDDRLTVTFSLRWLLTTVLLLQGGIDPAVLHERLAAHEQYQRFLADAQVWCPKIYASS